MRYTLDIHINNHNEICFPLRGTFITLGSSPFCDLTLLEETISRKQCAFIKEGHDYLLQDLSQKGTLLNDKAVDLQKLKHGDIISLGSKKLVFNINSNSKDDKQRDNTILLDNKPKKQNDFMGGYIEWKSAGKTRKIKLSKSIIIGADQDCDITLDDQFLSAKHCQLSPTENGIILRDLNSTNGTWIKKLRVIEAILPEKSSFRCGNTDFHCKGIAAKAQISKPEMFFGMVGNHPSLMKLQSMLKRIAVLDQIVLILGETGTGKELTARAIHALGENRNEPFIAVNCAALAPELIESELFGHEKGAFTGAGAKRIGAFEAAGSGTIFLDEIGELPLRLQPKLLRTLDSSEIKRVGASRAIKHKARVVTATNRDLKQRVKEGSFREDLFYRLSALPVILPSLRERREDIPLLAEHFLKEADVQVSLSKGACDSLMYHYWPGNIRELKNVITTSLCYNFECLETGILKEEQLVLSGPGALLAAGNSAIDANNYQGQTLQDAEASFIQEALSHYGGNKLMVSKALGISKSTLYDKIKRYQLK